MGIEKLSSNVQVPLFLLIGGHDVFFKDLTAGKRAVR